MKTPLTDAESLARSHRRRRWLVRIPVALLLGIVLLAVVAYILTSSSLTIEEAKVRFSQLSGNVTRADVEKVFGMPFVEQVDPDVTIIVWCFLRQSFDKTECYSLRLTLYEGEKAGSLLDYERTFTGWDAWKIRWTLLKLRLGLKVNE